MAIRCTIATMVVHATNGTRSGRKMLLINDVTHCPRWRVCSIDIVDACNSGASIKMILMGTITSAMPNVPFMKPTSPMKMLVEL